MCRGVENAGTSTWGEGDPELRGQELEVHPWVGECVLRACSVEGEAMTTVTKQEQDDDGWREVADTALGFIKRFA